ncbi:MAG: HlyD family efflux transporter periplasmic adaptor subunit [Solirubrobacteraceae bacterium]
MPRTRVLAGVAVLIAVAATGGAIVASGSPDATAATQEPAASTAPVTKGSLSDMVALNGTLTHRARTDGSPYAAINRAGGTYTALPDVGDRVGCGEVLYRVDDEPVLLLCGATPAYRDLHAGDVGRDVRQLNRNLHRLGYDRAAGVTLDPGRDRFTWRTTAALRRLHRRRGVGGGGQLARKDAVVLPRPVRIAKVTAQLGGPARPGAQVAQATSDVLEVQGALAGSQQGAVRHGDRARITLPGNRPVTGRVDRVGKVARTAGKDDAAAGDATIPVFIRLDDPAKARALDAAPVQVEITTEGVKDALSVPCSRSSAGRAAGSRSRLCARAGSARSSV